MLYRIEISKKSGVFDAAGSGILSEIREMRFPVKALKVSSIYFVEGTISRTAAERIAKNLLCDPVIETCSVRPAREPRQPDLRPDDSAGSWSVLKVFHPGVTDNVGETAFAALKGMKESGIRSVRTGLLYRITGSIPFSAVRTLSARILGNPLIESFFIRRSA